MHVGEELGPSRQAAERRRGAPDLGSSLARPRHVPQRSCLSCGRHTPKRELVRVVRTPDGTVEVDPTSKKAGRGSYLCHRVECWTQGLRKARLERVLRCTVPDEARERLLDYYQRQIIPSLVEEV